MMTFGRYWPEVIDMKERSRGDRDAVQMSVVIPHDTYWQLHKLRLERCSRGARMPALGQLVREAIESYIERARTTTTVVRLAGEESP